MRWSRQARAAMRASGLITPGSSLSCGRGSGNPQSYVSKSGARKPPRGERPERAWRRCGALYRGGRLRERPAPFLPREAPSASRRGREGGSAPPSGRKDPSRHPHLRPGRAGKLWNKCRPATASGSYALVRKVGEAGARRALSPQLWARNQATVCLRPSSSSVAGDHPSSSPALAGSTTIRWSSPGRASAWTGSNRVLVRSASLE